SNNLTLVKNILHINSNIRFENVSFNRQREILPFVVPVKKMRIELKKIITVFKFCKGCKSFLPVIINKKLSLLFLFADANIVQPTVFIVREIFINTADIFVPQRRMF